MPKSEARSQAPSEHPSPGGEAAAAAADTTPAAADVLCPVCGYVPCVACDGTGRLASPSLGKHACGYCAGTGVIRRVDLPPVAYNDCSCCLGVRWVTPGRAAAAMLDGSADQ